MKLIEVYLREGAFMKGEEITEAVHLWEEANFNAAFDERWFRGLLQELSSPQKERAAGNSSKRALNTPEVSMDAQEAAPPIPNERYVHTYREKLRTDSRIAYIQILDMKRPLELLNVYVRLRIHEDVVFRYNPSFTQYTAVARRDPNVVLRLDQQRQAGFLNTALEPEEAIHAYRRCVIVGDPGAGKTTLLRYLALKCAAQEFSELPDLPMYLELNTFASSSERLCGKASGLGLSQASQHDADHGEVNPGFFEASEHLIVFGKPTKGAKAKRRYARQSSGVEAHESRSVGSSPNRSPHPLGPRHLAGRSRDGPQSRRPIPAPP